MTCNVFPIRKQECRCECGYTCGGPGRCDLKTMECIEKHFVKDCGHDFGGELKEFGNGCYSIVCRKCGMSAMGHDEMCGP